jgi:DNA polymerase-1
LIDGNSLLQTGFHGVKDYFHNGKHFGAIFHFLNTIRKHLVEQDYNKVVVFWDGKNNAKYRQDILSEYKINRRKRLTPEQENDLFRQKHRITQYLEEVFVRQAEFNNCEADDCIAYYCANTEDENKLILTNDKDLSQLVNEKTTIKFLNDGKIIDENQKITISKLSVPTNNVTLIKILLGDKSDNIKGIRFLGEKTLKTYFPEIEEKTITLKEVLDKAKILVDEQHVKNKGINNLVKGFCVDGRIGDEFFKTNKELVDLEKVFLNDNAKKDIISLINENLDPEGRNYENIVTMMLEDGIFNVLPKKDDGWTEFYKPFIRLTKKEIKSYERKN